MKIMAKHLYLAGLCAGLLLTSTAWAEKADRSKPVNIESDSLRMDDARKAATYEGNVVLTQGTMMVKADRLDVRQDDKGFISSEAQGLAKPVYFRQKQEARDQFIEGMAKRVEYDARTDTVKLVGNARLQRGEEEVRGNLIVYNAKTETYRAVGSTQESGGGRVHAVIKPKLKEQDADKPGDGKP